MRRNLKKLEAVKEKNAGNSMEEQSPHLENSSPLTDYLSYYCSLAKPQFAVLVTGEWGIGKTFQVRQALGHNRHYYVSLFGLNSPERITAAVYAAMYPKKARIKKLSELSQGTSAEFAGFGLNVGGLPAALFDAILGEEIDNTYPIVFDDLERSAVKPRELLGIINRYVEHHGCRVIIIAHDSKLARVLTGQKEKVFGQTIRVVAQTDAAFDAFSAEIPDSNGRRLVVELRSSILSTFLASEVNSLRILRHVLKDLARLFETLSLEHIAHSEATLELCKLFCALSFECRGGRIKEDDLRNRISRQADYIAQRVAHRDEAVKPAHMIAQERYKTVQLDSELLPDEILIATLIHGHFNVNAIQQALNNSHYFIKPASDPPWRVVMSFDRLNDDVVQKGIADMERQFVNREISDPGELLHVFALRMLLASTATPPIRIDLVANECLGYIDDLLKSGRMPPREMNYQWREEFRDSAHGYTFWVQESYREYFETVRQHLLNARLQSRDAQFPHYAKEALIAMNEDGAKFFELTCYTQTGNNKYAHVPILAVIDPVEFVQKWKHSPFQNWYWISSALQERYTASLTNPNLTPELPWLRRVAELWSQEAHALSGIPGLRMRRRIPNIQLEQNKAASSSEKLE